MGVRGEGLECLYSRFHGELNSPKYIVCKKNSYSWMGQFYMLMVCMTLHQERWVMKSRVSHIFESMRVDKIKPASKCSEFGIDEAFVIPSPDNTNGNITCSVFYYLKSESYYCVSLQ